MIDAVIASGKKRIKKAADQAAERMRQALSLTQTTEGFKLDPSIKQDLMEEFDGATQDVAVVLSDVLVVGSDKVQADTVKKTHSKYAEQSKAKGRDPVAINKKAVTEAAIAKRAPTLDQASVDYGDNAYDEMAEMFDEDLTLDLDEDADPENEDDVMDALVEKIGSRLELRALLFLVTELVVSETIASQEALEEIASDDDSVQKEWIAEDEMCAECEDLDAEVRPVGEDFTDGAEPPWHPNCRCRIEPYVE